jgi:hypothetical protein
MNSMELLASSAGMVFGRRVLAALCCAMGCLPALASAQGLPAGTVVFVSGPVELVAVDGTRRAAQAGTALRQGEQVSTGADGYAHVRMIDNAFVAVRPASRLAVELYEYDSSHPSASRIKLQLHGGNTRTVSGKGGEAAKHNYRFNTPMAAIGLRGTDYTVLSSDAATRVSVSRGAVAVTPFGDGCSPASLGPCATNATRELHAGVSHAYMEVSARNRVPVLVRPEQDPQGGAGQNPPNRPEEPRAEAKPELKLATAKETVNQVAADKLALSLTPNAVEVPPPPPQFVWGRWSTFAAGAGAPAIVTLLDGVREVVSGNDVFALLRDGPLPTAIPAQGAFTFRMAASEAYTLNNGVIGPAQVRSGNLGIDFNQRTFSTDLSVQHAGGLEQLSALGKVQFQGLLIADPARSTMKLSGAVAGNGSEAAYLFDKQLAGGGLLGAVRWVR